MGNNQNINSSNLNNVQSEINTVWKEMDGNQLVFDFRNMLASFVGEKNGISNAELYKYIGRAQVAFETAVKQRGLGMMEWTELPFNQAEVVADIKEFASEVQSNYDNFVVLGIGGSALGASVIFDSLCHYNHNLLSKEKRCGVPKFFVEDNVDPDRLNALLDCIDLSKTMFNVVTKSGTTTEILAEFMAMYERVKCVVGEDNVDKHFVFTTDNEKGILNEFAKGKEIKIFRIPSGVGGRFSVLSPVGLLPACVLGVDIDTLLDGAGDMTLKCLNGLSDDFVKELKEINKNPHNCCEDLIENLCDCKDFYGKKNMNNFNNFNPALVKAILEFIVYKNGKSIVIIMPYVQKLKAFSFWYAQLLGESLGKKFDLNGNVVNVGFTPVCALGVTDQHSQQQLYVEGKDDKIVTFIKVNQFESKFSTPSNFTGIDKLDYISNVEFGNLMNIECCATTFALTKNERLNNSIIIEKLDAYALGQLFAMAMYEIVFLGQMLNVNAFDQPGVEDGKKATLKMLSKN